ncbi:PilZ domain-containing protein [Marinobacter sp. JSM 1782161]|uniref:PilZ domain-containing protein n=1 Tax=Marinobacter sp. JSM 1782161 TaxID=2685906 RepID=UPI001401D9C0|nr:PilZ domain-containing protein [Marinobacter sp. JSM 1782161]
MIHQHERAYIRHPADIPLDVEPTRDCGCTGAVRNLSRGGLAFSSPQPYLPGDSIDLIIRCCPDPLNVRGEVVWCEGHDSQYVVGVAFFSAGDAYQVRMVEQICQIEQYRRDVRHREKRELTLEEAAREWIERYAGSFAQSGWSDDQ